MTAIRTVAQAVSWIISIVVARLLTPTDYGIAEMGTVYLGLLMILAEFGLGRALLAHRQLTDDQVAGVNTIAAGLGVASLLVGVASAIPIAAFFHTRELLAVVPVLSINFLLISLRTVPKARLQLDLRFRELAIIELTQSLVQAVTVLALAILGFRYWSFVGGILLSGLVHTLLLIQRRPIRFAKPDFLATARTLRLSRQVLGSELAWYTFQHADFAIVGRRLGQAALGSYSIGWNLALLPLEKVSSVTVSITPSIFSAARSSRELVRRYLLAMTTALLLVTLPATIGIALTAPELIRSFLGTHWEASIGPLRVLAIYAALRCLDPMWTQLLMVTDNAGYAMRRNMTGAVVLPVAFWVGSQWGTVGVALSWMIMHPIVVVIPMFLRVSKEFEVTVKDQLSSITPAVVSTALMAVAVIVLREFVWVDEGDRFRLAASALAGVAVYVSALMLLFQKQVADVVSSVKRLRAPS